MVLLSLPLGAHTPPSSLPPPSSPLPSLSSIPSLSSHSPPPPPHSPASIPTFSLPSLIPPLPPHPSPHLPVPPLLTLLPLHLPSSSPPSCSPCPPCSPLSPCILFLTCWILANMKSGRGRDVGLKLPSLVRLLMIKTDLFSVAAFLGSLKYSAERFLPLLPLPMWIHLHFGWPFITPPVAGGSPVNPFCCSHPG